MKALTARKSWLEGYPSTARREVGFFEEKEVLSIFHEMAFRRNLVRRWPM